MLCTPYLHIIIPTTMHHNSFTFSPWETDVPGTQIFNAFFAKGLDPLPWESRALHTWDPVPLHEPNYPGPPNNYIYPCDSSIQAVWVTLKSQHQSHPTPMVLYSNLCKPRYLFSLTPNIHS